VHIKKNDIDKFAKDFTYIYNKAWAGHGGGKSLEERQVIKMFKTMKPVMDETISWFVYYKGRTNCSLGKPAGPEPVF